MLTPIEKKQVELARKLKPEINSNSLKHLTEGSFIEFKDEVCYVEEIGEYLEVRWKNFEKKRSIYIVTELKLFSLNTGKTFYIEWEEDDEMEVYLTLETLKLKDISFKGKPLTNKILQDIAYNEEGTVIYNNEPYEYSENDTWAALYTSKKYKNEKVRIYEFEHRYGNEYLTIEAWENEEDKPEKEAFLSKQISKNDIKILSINKK